MIFASPSIIGIKTLDESFPNIGDYALLFGAENFYGNQARCVSE